MSWKGAKNEQIKSFIQDSLIFNINAEVVSICVHLRRTKKIKTSDAIIAATALANGFVLVTDNECDFESIPDLTVINPRKL